MEVGKRQPGRAGRQAGRHEGGKEGEKLRVGGTEDRKARKAG